MEGHSHGTGTSLRPDRLWPREVGLGILAWFSPAGDAAPSLGFCFIVS